MTIIDTEGAGAIPRIAASTIKQLDGALESFTGSSLSGLIGRFLRDGAGGDGGNGRSTAAAERDSAAAD